MCGNTDLPWSLDGTCVDACENWDDAGTEMPLFQNEAKTKCYCEDHSQMGTMIDVSGVQMMWEPTLYFNHEEQRCVPIPVCTAGTVWDTLTFECKYRQDCIRGREDYSSEREVCVWDVEVNCPYPLYELYDECVSLCQ